MADNPLTKKLLIKPGQNVVLINPPEGYSEKLNPLPENAALEENPKGKTDFVHVFARNSQELEKHISTAMKVLEYDGIFWISYPKKSSGVKSDLSRDILWKWMEKWGLRPVAAVSIDAVWSALRFRPPERVKPKYHPKNV